MTGSKTKQSERNMKDLIAFAQTSIHMSPVIMAFGKLGRYNKVFRRVASELRLKIKRVQDWVDAFMQPSIAPFFDLDLCGESEEVVLEGVFFASGGPIFLTGMSGKYRKKAPRNVYWVDDWDEEKALSRIRTLILKAMEQRKSAIEKGERNWKNRDGFHMRRGARRLPLSNIVKSLKKPGLHFVGGVFNTDATVLLSNLIWSHLSDVRVQVITRNTGYITRVFIGLISELPVIRFRRIVYGDSWHLTPGGIARVSRAYRGFLRRDIGVTTCDPRDVSFWPSEMILYSIGQDRDLVVIESLETFYELWKKTKGNNLPRLMKLLRSHALERKMSIVLVRKLKTCVARRKCRVPKPADMPHFRGIKNYLDDAFLLFDPQYSHFSSIIRPGNTTLRELQIGKFKGSAFKAAGYCTVDLDIKHDKILEQK